MENETKHLLTQPEAQRLLAVENDGPGANCFSRDYDIVVDRFGHVAVWFLHPQNESGWGGGHEGDECASDKATLIALRDKYLC